MVLAAEQLANAGLYDDAWAPETIAQAKGEFGDLLRSMNSNPDCGAFGAPGTPGEPDPRFDGSALGTMQGAALRKALKHWERLGTLET